MNRQIRTEIFERFRAANPHPTTELEYQSTFQLLIAVILSAQATDVSVNIATRRFFPQHGTPEGILALGLDGLTDCNKSIGLYKPKQKCHSYLRNFIRALRYVFLKLEKNSSLYQVGRETANVVRIPLLSTYYGRSTHIFRVSPHGNC